MHSLHFRQVIGQHHHNNNSASHHYTYYKGKLLLFGKLLSFREVCLLTCSVVSLALPISGWPKGLLFRIIWCPRVKSRPFKLLLQNWCTRIRWHNIVLTIYTSFNQSEERRPVEWDVIGWKNCRWSKFPLIVAWFYRGKYRGWNGSTVEISCWADLARLSAGIKNNPKNFCSHVIFIVLFKFYI